MADVNLSTNPAIGADLTGWNESAYSDSTLAPVTGLTGFSRDTGAEVTVSGYVETAAVAVSPGTDYVFQCEFRSPVDGATTVWVDWYSSTAATTADFISGSQLDITFTAGEVDTLILPSTAPSGAVVGNLATNSTPVGSVYTAVMVYPGTAGPEPYRDGESEGWQWDGSRFLSTSSLAPVVVSGPPDLIETYSAGGVNSASVNVPNVSAGETLIAVVGGAYNDDPTSPTISGGSSDAWSVLIDRVGSPVFGDSEHALVKVFRQDVTSGSGATVTVSAQSVDQTAIAVLHLSSAGALVGTPSTIAVNQDVSTGTQEIPGITAATDNLVFGAWCDIDFGSQGGYTAPSEMTERADVAANTFTQLMVATEVRTADGATGSRTATTPSNPNGWAGALFAIEGAAVEDTGPVPPDIPAGHSWYLDISHFQVDGTYPILDLQTVKDLGYSGLTIKIGQGDGGIDPEWAGLRDESLTLWPNTTVGYWYLGVTESPQSQADRCLGAIGDTSIPVMLDWEDGGGDWQNVLDVLSAFRAVGLNVTMLYTRKNYAEANGVGDIAATGLRLANARYTFDSSVEGVSPTDAYNSVSDPATFGYQTYGNKTADSWQFAPAADIHNGALAPVSDFPGSEAELADMMNTPPSVGVLTGSGSTSSESSGTAGGSGSHESAGSPVGSESAGSGSASSGRDGSGSAASTSGGVAGAGSTRSSAGEPAESVSSASGAASGRHVAGGSVSSVSDSSAIGRLVQGGEVDSDSGGVGSGDGEHSGAGGPIGSTSDGSVPPGRSENLEIGFGPSYAGPDGPAGTGGLTGESGPTGAPVFRVERTANPAGFGTFIHADLIGEEVSEGTDFTVTWWARGTTGFQYVDIIDDSYDLSAQVAEGVGFPLTEGWAQYTFTGRTLTDWEQEYQRFRAEVAGDDGAFVEWSDANLSIAGAYSGAHVGGGSGGSESAGDGSQSGQHIGGGSAWTRSAGVGSGYAQQFAAAGIVRPIVGMTLRLIDDAGDPDEFLPDWTQIAFTDKYNAAGTIGLTYAKGGRFADQLLRDRAEGALFDGALEIPGTRFLVTQSATDGVKQDEAGNTVVLNAPVFVPTRLAEARVYPPGFAPAVTHTGAVKTQFANATPGELIGTLIAAAWGRDAILDVETDFSATLASDGAEWEQVVTIELDPGVTILSVLAKLTEMGVCDWSCHERTLILTNPDSGIDRTLENEPVVLQRGRDILDAPEKRDAGGLLTTVLVVGKDGVTEEVTDPALYEAYGRLEGHVSVSGVADRGTLRVIGETTLERAKLPALSYTHGLSLFADNGATPWVDYRVGDYVWRDVAEGQAPQRMRVAQLSGTYAKDKTVTGAITLGDRFDSVSQKLSARIDALTNGSGSASSAPADLPDEDEVAPAAPEGLQVSAEAYTLPNGGGSAAALSATWLPVQTNEDASDYRDHEAYRVQWRRSNLDAWISAGTTRQAGHNWSPVPTDLLVEVRVRAEDRNGNVSEWSEIASVLTPSDAEPPGIPTGITGENWIGTLRLEWTGEVLTDTGQAVSLPSDFRRAQVHVSTAGTGFTPTPDTLEDALTGPGRSNVNGLTPGTTYYARLVAEDYSGNLSAPSEAVSVTPREIVNLDLGPDAVDRANIRNAAIGSAQIDELAVNETHIARVNAGSILTGTLDADIAVAGSFNTSDDPNNRVRLDPLGLRMTYNGDVMFDVDTTTGDVELTGTVQTGTSGRRVVLSGEGNEIRFYPQAGETRFAKLFSFIPNNYPDDIAVDLRTGDSDTTDVFSRFYLLPDRGAISVSPQNERDSYFARVNVSPDDITLEIADPNNGNRRTDGGFLELQRAPNGNIEFGQQYGGGTISSLKFNPDGGADLKINGDAKVDCRGDGSTIYWGASEEAYLWLEPDESVTLRTDRAGATVEGRSARFGTPDSYIAITSFGQMNFVFPKDDGSGLGQWTLKDILRGAGLGT